MFSTMQSVRHFSSTASVLRVGCAMKKPVHHRVKIVKQMLSPRYPELKLSPLDIRSPKFKPTTTHQDRVEEHYQNTLSSDLLLINYEQGQQDILGNPRRKWDYSSPFHINRPDRKPVGARVPTPKIKVRSYKSVPKLERITINSYVKEAAKDSGLAISAALQLQQITGTKPKTIYSKSNNPVWGVRLGMAMGAKVELKGREMHQFLTTLTELVLPRIREFQGISNRSGDKQGNIAFGLDPVDVKLFPEIEANLDLWPKNFGLRITLHTSAQIDPEARICLSGYNLPFDGTERIARNLL